MVLTGKIKIFSRDRTPIVAALLPQDFADYYLWFARRVAWVDFKRPKTQFHLTVISSRFDGHVFVKAAERFSGEKIKVNFLMETMSINKIRKSKAIGLYCDVTSKDALDFRYKCGIKKPKKNFGGHATFGTTKGGTVDYWPERILINQYGSFVI